MTTHGTGVYQVTGWDEKAYDERDGQPKLTRASVTNTFTGVIDGTGTAELLMAYPSAAAASVSGFQTVDGSIDGRNGTFLLQCTGTWQEGVASVDWSVVPGSATGDLVGLTGQGGYVSTTDGACDLTLDYDFV